MCLLGRHVNNAVLKGPLSVKVDGTFPALQLLKLQIMRPQAEKGEAKAVATVLNTYI